MAFSDKEPLSPPKQQALVGLGFELGSRAERLGFRALTEFGVWSCRVKVWGFRIRA